MAAQFKIDFSDDALEKCKKLIALRRQFVHFLPMGWSIEKAGLPDLLLNCWQLIEQMTVIKPSYKHQLSSEQIDRLSTAVSCNLNALRSIRI